MASRKVPSHIARELQRHVKQAGSKRQQQQQTGTNSSSRNVLWGCLAFTGVAASIPFVSMHWIGGLNDKDQELTAAQVRRGAFMNSGSKDAGKDPNWDFATGTYNKNNQHYRDLFARDDPQTMEHGEEYFSKTTRKR